MNGIGKLLMFAGVGLFVIGLFIHFFKLGRLPGDILIKKGNTTFYFPVVTSILISILLTAVLYAIGRFK